MVGVTLKDRKSRNWIQKQSGMTDIIRNIREKANTDWGRVGTWLEVTVDGQSEPQHRYPMSIKDLEAE